MKSTLAFAGSSGTFKGVFVHGVLSALEKAGVRADGYAGASSSVLSIACAAVGLANEVGIDYWLRALELLKKPNSSLSNVVLQSISEYGPLLKRNLFNLGTPRFFIATSAVDEEGAKQTQGEEARRLGRRLLVSAMCGDKSWVEKHLRPHLFDSGALNNHLQLNDDNFDEVAYASTRMLHAWDIPAWVNGCPFVDASYTCSCPAVEMAQFGFDQIVAIAPEQGVLFRNIFRTDPIPEIWKTSSIFVIKPDIDPKEMGVDFTNATKEGLLAVYSHGEEKGREFISNKRLP